MARKVYSERQLRSQLMKQKIRDAARTLMRVKGYDAVTVDGICAEVGVTKGTFYNHFQSKEQMVLDNIAEDNIYYRTKLRQTVADMAPGLEKLGAFLRLAMAYENDKEREFTRFSYKLRIGDPKNTPAIYPDKRELYKIIEELIAEGQDCGEIRQDLGSNRLATIVLYAIRGVAYSWCLPDTDFDLIEVSEDLFEVLQEGLRKR